MKITLEIAQQVAEAANNILNGCSTTENRDIIRKVNNGGKLLTPKTKKNAQGLRIIKVGNNYKLRCQRSHINARDSLIVTVTDIMRANDARLDTYIATDGRREFCHLKRTDLIEIK